MTRSGCPHQEYDFLESIGTGSFGSVHRARSKATQRIVAIKVMKRKFNVGSECDKLLECRLRILLPSHPNIVQIYDCFYSSTHELSFVMEYMNGGNLYQFMKERRTQEKPFQAAELRDITGQILAAVSHIHQHGIFHRDLKPENLLITSNGQHRIVKLADFGLAREIGSKPPYTDYVSTRWYRAPEVLLRSTVYTASVDLWAIGCIFAELIALHPLLPGDSEMDQLYRICELLGSPGTNRTFGRRKSLKPEKRLSPGFARKKTTDLASDFVVSAQNRPVQESSTEWRDGVRMAHRIGFEFPQFPPKPLESVLPNASPSMVDLLQQFLTFDPAKRLTAEQALHHRFFYEQNTCPHPIHTTAAAATPVSPESHIYSTHELANVFCGQRDGPASSGVIHSRKERETTSIQLVTDTYDTTDEDSPISVPSSPFQTQAMTGPSPTCSRSVDLHTLDKPEWFTDTTEKPSETSLLDAPRTYTPPLKDSTTYHHPHSRHQYHLHNPITASHDRHPFRPNSSKHDAHQRPRPLFNVNKSESPPAKRPQSAFDDCIEEEMHTHRRLDFYLQNNHEPVFHLDNVTQYGSHLQPWTPPEHPADQFPTTTVSSIYATSSTGASPQDKRRSLLSETNSTAKESARHKRNDINELTPEESADSEWTWLKVL